MHTTPIRNPTAATAKDLRLPIRSASSDAKNAPPIAQRFSEPLRHTTR
jgi:hypothetical protein